MPVRYRNGTNPVPPRAIMDDKQRLGAPPAAPPPHRARLTSHRPPHRRRPGRPGRRRRRRVAIWLSRNISRVDAEAALANQPAGTYLVRASVSAPGDYAISLVCADGIQHHQVGGRGSAAVSSPLWVLLLVLLLLMEGVLAGPGRRSSTTTGA